MDALRTCRRPFVYPGPASERGNAENPNLPALPALQCRYALLRGRLLPALGLALVKQRVSLLLAGLAPGPKYPARDLVAGRPDR